MIKIKQKAALNFEKFLSFFLHTFKIFEQRRKSILSSVTIPLPFSRTTRPEKIRKTCKTISNICRREVELVFFAFSFSFYPRLQHVFILFPIFHDTQSTRKIRKYACSFYIIISMQPPLFFPLFHSRLFHFLVFASLALIN